MICSIPVVIGKPFTMSEMVHGGTGFICVPDFDPELIDWIKVDVSPFVKSSNAPVIGLPERYTFTFVARKAATSMIQLITLRPWAQ